MFGTMAIEPVHRVSGDRRWSPLVRAVVRAIASNPSACAPMASGCGVPAASPSFASVRRPQQRSPHPLRLLDRLQLLNWLRRRNRLR